MKILVACESSGLIRDAFAAKGHDAWSCDLEPTEHPGQHYQGDIFDILNNWGIIGGKPRVFIGHPVCTYLCNFGVSWLYHKDHADRWYKMLEAAWFFNQLWNLDIDKICLENPTPHKYANLPKYTQIIQPWQFGEDASKATCLWLKGLPKLTPTNSILKDRYSNQTKSGQNKLSPSEHRAKDRSRTYAGIANAMAQSWG